MTGIDIPIPECNIVIHQPTIKEISLIGEEEYFSAIQILCLDKASLVQDETLLTDLNNFKIFMAIITDKTSINKKKAVQQVFPLLFPNYSIIIAKKSLVFTLNDNNELKEKSEPVLIDETNFDFFQEILKQICCLSHNSMQKAGFNPQSKAAKDIADKLMRARQRVAQQKNENSNGSILGQYVSILTIAINSMSLQDCINLTLYQLFDLLERFGLYAAWDIDIKVRLAGGSGNESQPDNWMKNIH